MSIDYSQYVGCDCETLDKFYKELCNNYDLKQCVTIKRVFYTALGEEVDGDGNFDYKKLHTKFLKFISLLGSFGMLDQFRN